MFGGALVVAACSKEPKVQKVTLQTEAAIPVSDSLVKLGSTKVNGVLNVSVYAINDTLHTGYQALYFQLQDAKGNNINNAPFKIAPYMEMGDHGGHGMPALQPTYNSQNQMYEGGAFFSMQGYWDIKMSINGDDARINKLFVLHQPGTDDLIDLDENSNGDAFAVAVIHPKKFKTGDNQLSLLINKVMENVTVFQKLSGLEVQVFVSQEGQAAADKTPINLKDKGNGVYSGTINLPASGAWTIHYNLKKEGKTILKGEDLKIAF